MSPSQEGGAADERGSARHNGGRAQPDDRHAIAFLAEAGHITDDNRQEFVLLSDVLGASMQMITINNEAYANATEATVVGPFFVEGSPRIPPGGDIAGGAAGEPCWVEGTVTGTDGKPVPGARIEAWEADDDGVLRHPVPRWPDRRPCPPIHRPSGRVPDGPSPRRPTPSRTTALWASCWKRQAASGTPW
jgi:hypothetical protein